MTRSTDSRGVRWLGLSAWAALVGAVSLVAGAPMAQAGGVFATAQAHVVGAGTPASCTEAELDAALAPGGLVTFDCGPAPVTITITSTKTISTDTTIDGGSLITISGGNSVAVFSMNTGVTFAVQNLTIANGHGGGNDGGGITNRAGTLTVTNSTLSGNSADPAGGLGGGIVSWTGTLDVTNSTFSGNSAYGGGGGIAILDGTLHVTNSTFSGNSAWVGGAISNDAGTLTVTNSTFSGNSAYLGVIAGTFGGAISNGGMLTVINSTFSGNSADIGGGISNGATLVVINSTFSGNSASAGGGIFNVSTVMVTNSTFSSNSAVGEDPVGGGIASRGPLTVTNSTFSGNSAGAGGSISGPSLCCGTRNVVTNTIVANSPGGNCTGSVIDGGHNIDDGATCGFTSVNGSLSNTTPQLDPAGLRNNGGPTQTVVLCTAAGVPAGCTAASPAIDAGDQAVCAAAPVNGGDQRGYARPGSGHTQCSIGAYEADALLSEPCVGDCDGTGSTTIDELITLVNIALGTAQASACPHGVPSGAEVDVALIIQAVNVALNGCGVSPAEQGCLTSGGTVTAAMCCASSGDFPDTCAIGVCGCAPAASHEVRVCDCGAGCFDGSGCVRQ